MSNIKELIEELIMEREVFESRVKKIDKAIEGLRDICKHQTKDGEDAMEYIGHDSHKDYHRCKLCGKEVNT